MKFSFFAVVAATLTLGITAPASAANLLMCKVSNAGASRGWISDKIVIAYEEGKKDVLVFDRVISNYGSESAVGKVETDNAKRTTFVWEVKVTDSKRQHATMQYRLTFLKKNHGLRLTVNPLGYRGDVTGKGICTPTVS
ncbi:hypothetical protein AB9F29_09535 [Falsihalocynthiibacter sp. S25ZX9]|uniref:hypothetical protein n=1 Tax=Falsihalocynthiibacter sp. S25ZX9 TaxID=3240870 RepID=UPI0035101965